MDLANLVVLSIIAFYAYYQIWSIVSLVAVLIGCSILKKQIKGLGVSKISGQDRGVLITGCDTGIGHATAVRLHSLGFTVFAGCLQPENNGGEALRMKGDGMHVIHLDVTSDESVESVKTYVQNHKPKKGLFAIINNAGINIMADVELATMEMYKRVAEVNIYGMIRVTRSFCPLIRHSKGRIVNVTSVKGLVSGPLDSTYTITKWAGEAFSDILRREMIRFGVKVIIMEPGDFGGLTGMLSTPTLQRMERDLNSAWEAASDNVRTAYGREYIEELLAGIKGAGTTCAKSLDPVTDAMEDAVTNESPKYRYLVDGSSSLVDKYCVFARLNPFLPEWLMDFLLPYFFPMPVVKQNRS